MLAWIGDSENGSSVNPIQMEVLGKSQGRELVSNLSQILVTISNISSMHS